MVVPTRRTALWVVPVADLALATTAIPSLRFPGWAWVLAALAGHEQPVALAVLAAKLSGHVAVPGYAATILVVLFFGAFNALGLGIIGSYVWRAFENTKRRPLTVEQHIQTFAPDES